MRLRICCLAAMKREKEKKKHGKKNSTSRGPVRFPTLQLFPDSSRCIDYSTFAEWVVGMGSCVSGGDGAPIRGSDGVDRG